MYVLLTFAIFGADSTQKPRQLWRHNRERLLEHLEQAKQFLGIRQELFGLLIVGFGKDDVLHDLRDPAILPPLETGLRLLKNVGASPHKLDILAGLVLWR